MKILEKLLIKPLEKLMMQCLDLAPNGIPGESPDEISKRTLVERHRRTSNGIRGETYDRIIGGIPSTVSYGAAYEISGGAPDEIP